MDKTIQRREKTVSRELCQIYLAPFVICFVPKSSRSASLDAPVALSPRLSCMLQCTAEQTRNAAVDGTACMLPARAHNMMAALACRTHAGCCSAQPCSNRAKG